MRKSVSAFDVTVGLVTTLGVVETVERRGDIVRVTFVAGGSRTCTIAGRFYLA